MKIIFAGTPDFAATALTALLEAGHHIVAVYTQPDRPAGRGQKLALSAVKQCALAHGLPVFQPLTLKSSSEEGLAAQAQLHSFNADVMVVAAYGLILPQAVLDMPRFGCLNIHASLLPRWRGAAPIQRAILAGDETTGITIMQMAAGLDTGDMLYRAPCPILATDTSGLLHDKLAHLGGQAICHTLINVETLAQLQANRTVQLEPDVTYAQKLTKAEAQLDWAQPAMVLDRKIRGYAPSPVAFFMLGDASLRVWSAVVLDEISNQPCGTVISVEKQGISVCCGDGHVLQLTSIQWPGGKALNSVQIFQTQKFVVGQQLERATLCV